MRNKLEGKNRPAASIQNKQRENEVGSHNVAVTREALYKEMEMSRWASDDEWRKMKGGSDYQTKRWT